MDALLGALAEGDIGKWFPDTDPAFKNADSVKLLEKILSDEIFSRWEIVNLDITIIAETPRIAQYVQKMREKTAVAAGCEISRVSVKATTTEKLGFCGRGEGIVATAVVLLAVRNFPAN
jgi:2-C-methyl-D-erythritol 2,4-cyclodiphosphate synthase